MARFSWRAGTSLWLVLLIGGPVLPASAQPAPQIASSYQSGTDLETVVHLLQEQSLDEGGRTASLSSERSYRELIVAQDVENKGRDPLKVEHEVIERLLGKYGNRGDALLSAEQWRAERERDRSAVEVTPVGDGISQIRISLLGAGSSSQVSQALHQADYHRGVILDLRGASGSDPQSVADVARYFLPASIKPLVQTAGARNRTRRWDSKLRGIAYDTPLVVLVSKNTRTGAEALAALLGRSGRAQVLGSTTAGADLYSETFALPSGAAVRLVSGRWRTGDGRGFADGVEPTEQTGADPLARAVELLASQPGKTLQPTVFPARSTIGDKQLGFNAGTGDLGLAGAVEYFPGGQSNVMRPNDELKIWFVPDYIVLNYKPASSLINFFADRIYTTAPGAATDKGIRIGSTYSDIVEAYGPPGTGGYNELFPFPERSRANRPDRYYVNYDAIGVSFGLETGTNVVREIGIYKPGS
ncbi:S41 family peptidase [Gloeobacter kilaueensis]|uniref:Carboxyl-terminal protease n=1 Tax=Gloeobacter kilaueensis (strain ATCC BAA-2537 / CCAP 1431/1 / ULC 316 / JS1) TaxID=1183438 RepID=U5QLJ0_GLOK1|nr:S41 family peptidase [Gloeobacter kilaueensis]AGY58545.1 carboxyl-terminal protease [Gloeobacter kilaueensis JS1]